MIKITDQSIFSTIDRVIFMLGVNEFKGMKLETLYYIIAFICAKFLIFFYNCRNVQIHDSAKVPQTLCFIILR